MYFNIIQTNRGRMIKQEPQPIKTESANSLVKSFKPFKPTKLKNTKRRSFTRWTPEENNLYAIFLRKEAEVFQSEWKKRSTKVFMRLSKLLSTKTANQCKSHHQKMMEYCGSHENIINKYLIFDFEQLNCFSPPKIDIKIEQLEQDPYVVQHDDNVSQHLLTCAFINQLNFSIYCHSLLLMNQPNNNQDEIKQIGGNSEHQ